MMKMKTIMKINNEESQEKTSRKVTSIGLKMFMQNLKWDVYIQKNFILQRRKNKKKTSKIKTD